MNGQDDKPRSSPSGSSSAQSPPQDAPRLSDELDKASVRELGRTLDSLRQQTETLREENRVLRKTTEAQLDRSTNAIKKNAIELAESNKRADAFIKLVREVLGEERKAVGTLAASAERIDQSAKHMLLQKAPDSDEITGRQWRYLLTHRVGPWLAARGFFVKLFATLAAAAGAAWAYLTHKH